AGQSLGEPVSQFGTLALHARGLVNRGVEPKDAKAMLKSVKGIRDVGEALSRLTDLFEARRPREPAPIAEIDGRVELLAEKDDATWVILVKNEGGIEREYLVRKGCPLFVHAGDHVRAGDLLADGPPVPRDILRVSGEAAIRSYLLHAIQDVYRAQGIEVDDKHLEIIIAQMLRKVRIEDAGDTDLLSGSVINKVKYQTQYKELANYVKIMHPGDTDFRKGDIVLRDHCEQENLRVGAEGGWKARWTRPRPARPSPLL